MSGGKTVPMPSMLSASLRDGYRVTVLSSLSSSVSSVAFTPAPTPRDGNGSGGGDAGEAGRQSAVPVPNLTAASETAAKVFTGGSWAWRHNPYAL